jgi:hypothetical protein
MRHPIHRLPATVRSLATYALGGRGGPRRPCGSRSVTAAAEQHRLDAAELRWLRKPTSPHRRAVRSQRRTRSPLPRHTLLRVVWAVVPALLAACANGLAGEPSAEHSPAEATDLALRKATAASRRESLGARCFEATEPGLRVERRAVEDVVGARHASLAPRMTTGEARQALQAGGSDAVPVYCRIVEPRDVEVTRSAESKLRETAGWYATQALVLLEEATPVTVRAVATASYRDVQVFATGVSREVMYDRSGAVTSSPTAAMKGGSRRLEPVLGFNVSPRIASRTMLVPGSYTEAWLLVRVGAEHARRHRAACTAAGLAWALRVGQLVSYETARACGLYHGSVLQPTPPTVMDLDP